MVELFFLLFAGSLLAASGDDGDQADGDTDDAGASEPPDTGGGPGTGGGDEDGDDDLVQAVIRGTEGADDITGTEADERIFGFGQDDDIDGGEGNDTLNGDDGNDEIFGRTGDDVLRGGNGVDRLVGGEGNDLIVGGDGNDVLNAGGGDDTMYGMEGNDFFRITGASQAFGGAGNDHFEADAFVADANIDGAIVSGGEGDDDFAFLEGNSGRSVDAPIDLTANGGEGDDSFEFHTHGVTVSGGAGTDTFLVVQRAADAGQELSVITDFDPADGEQLKLVYDSDILNAETAEEFLTFRDDGTDAILSFQGDDIVRLEGLAGQVGLSDVALAPSSAAESGLPTDAGDIVAGTDGDDSLSAGGRAVIMGFGGDDEIVHTGGADNREDDFGFVSAGEGNDTVTVEGDYVRGVLGDGDDVLIIDAEGSSQISGTNLREETLEFRAGAGDDTMIGGAGNDQLDGEEGDDFIVSGGGTDIVRAGTGADTVVMAGDGSALLGVDEDPDTVRVVDTVARLNGEVDRIVVNSFEASDDVLVFELPAGTPVPEVTVNSFEGGFDSPGDFENTVLLNGVNAAFIYSFGAAVEASDIQFVTVGVV